MCDDLLPCRERIRGRLRMTKSQEACWVVAANSDLALELVSQYVLNLKFDKFVFFRWFMPKVLWQWFRTGLENGSMTYLHIHIFKFIILSKRPRQFDFQTLLSMVSSLETESQNTIRDLIVFTKSWRKISG